MSHRLGRKDFIYSVLHLFSEFAWLKLFCSPFPLSYLIFIYVDLKRIRTTPPLTSPLLAMPPSMLTQIQAASKAQTPVLCLTWCLLPSMRTNKDFAPPPLTIWGPPPSRLPSWWKNPFTTPLVPHNLKNLQNLPLRDLLCLQAVAKDSDQLLLTERKEGLKGNRLLLLSPLSCLVCLCECVYVLPSRSAGSVSLLYARPFSFFSMTPNLQMDGV